MSSHFYDDKASCLLTSDDSLHLYVSGCYVRLNGLRESESDMSVSGPEVLQVQT